MCPIIIQNLCFKNYSPCKIHSLGIPPFWLLKNVKLFHLFIISKSIVQNPFLLYFISKFILFLILDLCNLMCVCFLFKYKIDSRKMYIINEFYCFPNF